jgi:quercetin dioxygenase-like cupin family protein
MYCRQVFRHADVTIVGKVHKKEHFYVVVFGTVMVTTDSGVEEITGPKVLCCRPGTKRAVHALTDALCMTFHIVNATTVEGAETELVEDDPTSMFTIGNKVKSKELPCHS